VNGLKVGLRQNLAVGVELLYSTDKPIAQTKSQGIWALSSAETFLIWQKLISTSVLQAALVLHDVFCRHVGFDCHFVVIC